MSMLAGRDQISEVLTPVLGAVVAMERANNIVQALVFRPSEPARVACSMLRGVVASDVERLACQVEQAWERGLTMEKTA